MTSQNPLLAIDFLVPFDAVKAEHVEPAVDALIAESRARLAAVIELQCPRTFENTMEAFEAVTERLGTAMGVVGHLEGVATTPALRAAYTAVQPRVSEFYSSLLLSDGLFRALKAYGETADAKALPATRRRFLDKTLADFRRQGAELDASGKERLTRLDVELTTATVRYSQNVLDATAAFELYVDDVAELAGLPEAVIEAAKAGASARGKAGHRLTLQAPCYVPVMTYAANAKLREAMWRAYNSRATQGERDNRPLIATILGLRHEKARLLGFKDFADFVLEDRMAKKGGTASTFIARLADKTRPFFEAENAQLVAYRKRLEGPSAPALEPWDVGYYSERLRVEMYDFDDEALRPYFASEAVVAALFSIAERLYGLRIEAWPDAPLWHPTVKGYRVADDEGAWIGSFYVDMYPRESKRDGAWLEPLITGVWQPGKKTKHLGIVAANLAPPVGDKPSLLNHREVETLFHEFGHLMHHLLSKVDVRSLGGTQVAWDFVELPSMIMENWCWDRDVLSTFARHYETKAPIPDELLTKMHRARNFRAANAMMRQLGFSALDLALHTAYDPVKDGDVMAYARRVFSDYSAVPLPDDYAMIAGFSHLFSSPVGYAAGYYSYKWAEVLDADAFTRFREEGVMTEKAGRRFRDAILSKGDSRDPGELFREFMGRDPREEALLERSGLVGELAVE